MNKATTKTLILSSKPWLFVVAVALAASFFIPTEVLAVQSEKSCIYTQFDHYLGLYFRQIKVKEMKLSQVGQKGSRRAAPQAVKPASKTPVLPETVSTLQKLILVKPIVRVAMAGKIPASEKPDKRVRAVITAYTSTPEQTDDTPDIAASGKHVYDGMIAANWLPFGTKVRIPALYGSKIFTVDDRMNKRYGHGRMDIWLDASVSEARQFGVKRVEVEIFYKQKQPTLLTLAR